MSRGTDDFTVQQLINFLGEKLAAIDEELPNQHRSLGYAYMTANGNSSNVPWHAARIQDATERRTKLQQLAWDIESQCGELHSKRAIEVQP